MTEPRQDWLQARKAGIGGSDAAAILGISKYRTPLQVYLDKIGELPEQPDNPAMLWGRTLEPVIRQRYSDITGREVHMHDGIIRCDAHPFMLANLDGFTEDGRVLEIKTARSAEGWGEPGSDEIPEVYQCQVQHYMVVTGFVVADVAVLIGGSDFRLYEVPADQELQEIMVEREAAFWRRVEAHNPPEPETLSDMALRFRKSVSGEVEATPEAIAAVSGLKALREEIKRLEAEEDRMKVLIQGCLGDKEGLTINGKLAATWKSSKPTSRFDTESFKAGHADLYNQYLKTGEASRRFLLK